MKDPTSHHKQPIAFIGIERETTASVKHGIERRVNIRIYRSDENGNFDKAGNYCTNPLLVSRGKISAASVARAERAQMVLTRPAIDTTPVEDEVEPSLHEQFSAAMPAQAGLCGLSVLPVDDWAERAEYAIDHPDENPYLLSGPELSRAVAARLQGNP